MASEAGVETTVARADEEIVREPVSTRTVFRWAVAAGLGLLTVWLAWRAATLMADVFVQILIAAFIAVSLDPAVRWMVRHKVRRGRAVLAIVLSVVALVVVSIWLLIPPLLHQSGNLTTDFPGYLDGLRDRSPSLRSLEDRFHLQQSIHNFAERVPATLGHQALSFGQRFLGAVLSALLVIVLTIYFMIDLPRLRRALVRLFPKRHRRSVNDVVNVVVDKVGSYMIGNLIVSAFAGAATLVALLALGVPFALPLALWVAVTDLIPMIGATLGASVCVVVAFATRDLWPTTILVVVFFVVYQQLENYVISPRVMRNAVSLPSLAVLVAALLGGTVLGLVGALMAIPIAAAIGAIMTPVMRARDEEPARDTPADEPMIAPDA